MKFPVLASLTLAASLAMSPVFAEEKLSAHDQAMQDYNDSQFCAALLKKLGGADNLAKSERALAHARTLASVPGHNTEEAFMQSYTDAALIIDMADETEMKQFTKFCVSKW